MINTILGTKKNMTVIFDKAGNRLALTVVDAQPNFVYLAKNGKIQIAAGQTKKPKKTQNNYLTAFGFAPRRIKEVKAQEGQEDLKTGDQVTVSIFKRGDLVKVTCISKGKGFAGGMKRWGFKGGPKTHGQSDRARAPGSIGQTTTPGRVFKGKKMAGHMGNVQKTVRNLEIIDIDDKNNILFIKGAVPGYRNGHLIIEKTGELKNPRELEGLEVAVQDINEPQDDIQDDTQNQPEDQTEQETPSEASKPETQEVKAETQSEKTPQAETESAENTEEEKPKEEEK